MKTNPLISVIVPLYNKEKSIEATIASVLKQNISDFELLVIDDGSTDNSFSVVQQFDDKRVLLYAKKNGGVSSARNYGIKKSKGNFLFFLDADDEILKNSFTIFIELLNMYPNQKLFTTNFIYSENNVGSEFCIRKEIAVIKNPFKEIFYLKIFPRPGNLFIHRNLISNMNLFNEKISKHEDLDFIIRLLDGKKIVYSPRPTFIYKRENAELSLKKNNYRKEFISIVKIEGSFYKKIVISKYILNYYNGLFNSLYHFSFNSKTEFIYLTISFFISVWIRIIRKLKRLPFFLKDLLKI